MANLIPHQLKSVTFRHLDYVDAYQALRAMYCRKEPSASSAKTAHQRRHRLPTHRLRSRQALNTLGIR